MRGPLTRTFRTQSCCRPACSRWPPWPRFAMFFRHRRRRERPCRRRTGVEAPRPTSRRACGTVNVKGVTAVPNAGNPFLSTSKFSLNGHLISYGNTAITYANPPQAFVWPAACCSPDVLELPRQPGPTASTPRGRPPSARTCKGSATPRSTSGSAPGACRRPTPRRWRPSGAPTRLTPLQALELAAWVNSLAPLRCPQCRLRTCEGRQPVGGGGISSPPSAPCATPSRVRVTIGLRHQRAVAAEPLR